MQKNPWTCSPAAIQFVVQWQNHILTLISCSNINALFIYFCTTIKLNKPHKLWKCKKVVYLITNNVAFSTGRSGATVVKFTGDELWLQHFSAPTHPTGYVWEEKQVRIIRKKNGKKRPNDIRAAARLITVHPCNIIF